MRLKPGTLMQGFTGDLSKCDGHGFIGHRLFYQTEQTVSSATEHEQSTKYVIEFFARSMRCTESELIFVDANNNELAYEKDEYINLMHQIADKCLANGDFLNATGPLNNCYCLGIWTDAGNLGNILLQLEKYDLALDWYKRGLEKGVLVCNERIGHLYKYGLGVPVDRVKAEQLFNTYIENDTSFPDVVSQVDEFGKIQAYGNNIDDADFQNNAINLGVNLRLMIEGICNLCFVDFPHMKEKKLSAKIEALSFNKILKTSEIALLNDIREFGNGSAHANEVPSIVEAKALYKKLTGSLEHILREIYVFWENHSNYLFASQQEKETSISEIYQVIQGINFLQEKYGKSSFISEKRFSIEKNLLYQKMLSEYNIDISAFNSLADIYQHLPELELQFNEMNNN